MNLEMNCGQCRRHAPVLLEVTRLVGNRFEKQEWCPTCLVAQANASAFPRAASDE